MHNNRVRIGTQSELHKNTMGAFRPMRFSGLKPPTESVSVIKAYKCIKICPKSMETPEKSRALRHLFLATSLKNTIRTCISCLFVPDSLLPCWRLYLVLLGSQESPYSGYKP